MLADIPGDRDRTGLLLSKGKPGRVDGFAGRGQVPRRIGPAIIRELERERSRIARELHAGVGQPLAAIRLNLEMLSECAAALPQQAREALARLEKLSVQASEQVRALSHILHPPEWQNLTIADALHSLLESSGLAAVIAVEIHVQRLVTEPAHATKIAIYRCAQECLSNVAQHSGATRVELRLVTRGAMLELRVEDNGCGFADLNPHTGIGLLAIHEHAIALGGDCDISSAPTGSTVVVQLPLGED
jgi:signal transduction histidine kinase